MASSHVCVNQDSPESWRSPSMDLWSSFSSPGLCPVNLQCLALPRRSPIFSTWGVCWVTSGALPPHYSQESFSRHHAGAVMGLSSTVCCVLDHCHFQPEVWYLKNHGFILLVVSSESVKQCLPASWLEAENPEGLTSPHMHQSTEGDQKIQWMTTLNIKVKTRCYGSP